MDKIELSETDLEHINQAFIDSSQTDPESCGARAWFGAYSGDGNSALSVAASAGWSHGEVFVSIKNGMQKPDWVCEASYEVNLDPETVHPALGTGWDSTILHIFPELVRSNRQ